MQSILEQYAKHIIRLRHKGLNKARNKDKGIAWYTAAAERVQALIDAPTPAWVGATGKFVRL